MKLETEHPILVGAEFNAGSVEEADLKIIKHSDQLGFRIVFDGFEKKRKTKTVNYRTEELGSEKHGRRLKCATLGCSLKIATRWGECSSKITRYTGVQKVALISESI